MGINLLTCLAIILSLALIIALVRKQREKTTLSTQLDKLSSLIAEERRNGNGLLAEEQRKASVVSVEQARAANRLVELNRRFPQKPKGDTRMNLTSLTLFELLDLTEQTLTSLNHALDVEKQQNAVLSVDLATLSKLIEEKKQKNKTLSEEYSKHKDNLAKLLESNLSSMPWLAGMMADFLTYDLEVQAKKLEWGHSIERAKKVTSIRQLRRETALQIGQAKLAYYQLAYIQTLFPGISDVLMTEYNELEISNQPPEHDATRDFLSKEEWDEMEPTRRDQLALDRYIASHKKTNWQIGRDYELSVAYQYIKKGYHVALFGALMGYEDLSRDLIAKKGDRTLLIQCKYWAQSKLIHEKHIFQLYGTTISYCLEHNLKTEDVFPLFVTNIKLSSMARKVATYLSVTVIENHPLEEYPRIKCNIGRDEYGETKIYHLPIDQQYDSVKIEKAGEFYAYTVSEAVQAGFRRAYRWHG